jgi:hypothetical protein
MANEDLDDLAGIVEEDGGAPGTCRRQGDVEAVARRKCGSEPSSGKLNLSGGVALAGAAKPKTAQQPAITERSSRRTVMVLIPSVRRPPASHIFDRNGGRSWD